MDTLTLSTMEAAHLAGAHRLSQDVGWPHRQEDWALLLSLSRGAVILEGDTVVATAFATPMGPVAIANMIIVDAAKRGAGLGRRVMEAAMARVSSQEWRLVATKDGLPLYQRMGFAAQGEILQHQGIARPAVRNMPLPPTATADDLEALASIDRAATGMDRRGLIAALLAEGRVFVQREEGQVVGFAAQRAFGRGAVIGPVIARTRTEAEALVQPLISAAEGTFVRIDIDAECGLADWLTARGLVHVGGGVKMSRGLPSKPSGRQQRYALAAQSLG